MSLRTKPPRNNLGVSCGLPGTGGEKLKKRHCVIFRFFLIFFSSSAFVGKVKTASAGIDTVTNTVVGLVWTISIGVHICKVAVVGKTGFGVTGSGLHSHSGIHLDLGVCWAQVGTKGDT